MAELSRVAASCAAAVNHDTISGSFGTRPVHFTTPSTTTAGVIITPNVMISSSFSTLERESGSPDAATAFSASA
jgi:hypothetical protein